MGEAYHLFIYFVFRWWGVFVYLIIDVGVIGVFVYLIIDEVIVCLWYCIGHS